MATNGDDTVKVVPVRHFGRWVGAGGALLFIAMLVHTLFSKVPDTSAKKICHLVNAHQVCAYPVRWRFQWNYVFQYFTTSEVLHGLWVTLELTVISMTIGIILGVLIAVMRLSRNRLLSSTAWSYTWFFRGTPVYVQLIFWSNIAILFPYITIGLPFLHVTFLSFKSVSLFSPFRAAIVAFGLNEAAYMSEIARSGLIAVDEGQSEAATSLGMTRGQTLRFVVLPQAMRVILPPTGNEIISMLKTTSLASYIGVAEVLGVTGFISAANFETMALLIVASLWYLLVTTVLSIGQFYLERRFAKGALRTPPMTPIQRMRHDVRGIAAKFPTGHRALGGTK